MSPLVQFFLAFFAFLAVFGFCIVYYYLLWRDTREAGAPVSLIELLGITLRKAPAHTIVNAYVMLRRHGIDDVTLDMLEGHYLAGHRLRRGDVIRVARCLIRLQDEGTPVNFMVAAAHDFDGRLEPNGRVRT